TFAPPTSQTGPVTFVDKPNKTYRFVPNGADAEVTATYGPNDAYTDDGASATMAKFDADLSVGDVITYTKNTPAAGVNRHELTNKTPSSYNSGVVGNIDESAHTLYIIEPVSGVALSDAKNYATNAVWSVDGASQTQAVFEGALDEGDTIVITPGTGGGTSTFALANATVDKLVSSFDTTNKFVMLGHLGDYPPGSQDATY